MTSRNRYLSLFKEDMKRRTLSIVLSIIVEFLLFPVGALFFFQTLGGGDSKQLLERTLHFVDEPVGAGLYLIAVCGALICAYSGFSYLFSKKQVDFYHGLPYNRRKQFLVRYLNGYFVYLIPLLVFLLVSLPVYMMNSGLQGGIGSMLMVQVFRANLVFLLIYNLVIVGVMLAGNASNAGFMSMFIGIYVFIMGTLADGYFGMFLDTYRNGDLKIYEMTKYLSPLLYPIELQQGGGILPIIILNVLLLAISYFLFLKRKLEKAGSGALYSIPAGIVRFGMTVMVGLGLGLVFTVSNSLTGWMLFGILFGSAVTHVLINALFHMSIKAALKGKKFLVIAIVTAALAALAVRYDCFGYDAYLPSKEAVQSVSVQLRGFAGTRELPSKGYLYTIDEKLPIEEAEDYYKRAYRSSEPEIPVTVENDSAYRLITLARDGNERRTFLETEETIFEKQNKPFFIQNIRMDVEIKLKNGGSMIRHYQFPDKGEFSEAYEKMYYTEEYKEANIKASIGDDKENLRYVMINRDNIYGRDIAVNAPHQNAAILNVEKAQALHRAFSEDLRRMSINEEGYTENIARITFVYEDEKGMKFYGVSLSPFHTETLSLLGEYGLLGTLVEFFEKGEGIRELKVLNYFDEMDEKERYDEYPDDYFDDYTVEKKGEPRELLLLTDPQSTKDFYHRLVASYHDEKRILQQGKYLVRIKCRNDALFEMGVLTGSAFEAQLESLIVE